MNTGRGVRVEAWGGNSKLSSGGKGFSREVSSR